MLLQGQCNIARSPLRTFPLIASPLHSLTGFKQVSFSGKARQHKSFDTLKGRINTVPILALRDLQHPFEIEIEASGYAIGVVLMQPKKPIRYHSETFSISSNQLSIHMTKSCMH
jgi:hypothetical protein